ncbi:hypothetical protein [Variovorax sp. N23]|uniref:hypothetical protein n=1 Tax=Variovorax sp. N23 TaxID=2980555 RepID=UPI0021C58D8A|nr:hypothetical protein [Variovorax sp. N23]MCU4121263.1 hypothetical protein [Variovorax sp. N23]
MTALIKRSISCSRKHLWINGSSGEGFFSSVGGRIFFWLLVLLKLTLVAQNEVLAFPNDSAVFVKFALSGVSELGPPVGYPLWLLVVKLVGVPQRIAIELLYLFCCFYLCKEIGRVLGRRCSLALMFLLFFSPVSFHLFDNALSDALYVCLVLLCMGLSFRLIQGVSILGFPAYLFLGVVLGFMGVVRNESEIIFAWLGWLAIFLVWRVRKWQLSRSQSLAVARNFLCTVGVVALLGATPAAFHWAVQGVWVKTLPQLPSHMKLLSNLAAIDVGSDRTPRISVSKEARLKAYAASPSLSILKPHIEDEKNMYMAASHAAGLPAGEIGNGWVWHVFNDAALAVLPNPRTVESLDAFWGKVNNELESAYASDALRRRFVLHPFISGGPLSIIKSLPAGLLAAYEKVFVFMPNQLDRQFASDEFDELALRRTTLVERKVGNIQLRGWVAALSAETIPARVQIGVPSSSDTSVTTWVDATLHPRDDVTSSLSSRLGKAVNVLGFEVKNAESTQRGFQLRYFTNRGVLLSADNEVDVVRQLNSAEAGEFLAAIDRFAFSGDESSQGLRAKIQRDILNWVGWGVVKTVGLALVCFACVAAVFCLFFGQQRRSNEAVVLLIFIVGVIFQRLVFYGVLDRLAWEVEPRYVAPIFALWIVAVVLAARSFWVYKKPSFQS